MKPSTKRLLSFTLAILFLIGSLVVFFNLIQPAYRGSQAMKAEIYSKEVSLKNEKNAAQQVQSLLEQYRGNNNPRNAVSAALPPANNQAEVVHELQSLAALNQLAVQSLAVSQPGSKPVATAASRAAAASSTAALVKPVGVVTAQVRVAGPYASFKSFLAAVETNIRLTDIQALVVTPVGKPNQDFYTFDLTLSTYYQN